MTTKIDFTKTRELLQSFDFGALFVDVLGWSQPVRRPASAIKLQDQTYKVLAIAELGGVVVFEVQSPDGKIPGQQERRDLYRAVVKLYHEHLLIFVNKERNQSLWYWVKRDGNKVMPRNHFFVQGQPGDLFLSKLSAMVVDISELSPTGTVNVSIAARRLSDALDIQVVTKKFFREFQEQHDSILASEALTGIDDPKDRRWYASVLLNRLMFIYFLQRKHFLDGGNVNYLQDKLDESKKRGKGRYFSEFLKALFFVGFAKPESADEGDDIAKRKLIGRVPYLNGGLFLPHPIEIKWPGIDVTDEALRGVLELFRKYSWNLDDTPGGDDNEINPEVLGYIFEKYINQKAFGAYYTPVEITSYLCEHTIHKMLLDKINRVEVPGIAPARKFDTIADLLINLDAQLCRELKEELSRLSILDPACGSGAFLVAAMQTLITIYSAVVGKIKFLKDPTLTKWVGELEEGGRSLAYAIKKLIITDNLYGVDIMPESIEIAKLRLFLALVSSASTVEQLEPLPNIDFNILSGNSLIGLLRVTDEDFKRNDNTLSLFHKTFSELVAEKNRLVDTYRKTITYQKGLKEQRELISEKKREATETLDSILLEEFKGIKYEQATWDAKANKEGKPVKRAVTHADVEDVQPFHWGYEFDQILNFRGGFDIIITNPPWEIFKPQAKEFFADPSDPSNLITKNKMSIHEFEAKQSELLELPEVRSAWLAYESRFPHVSAYFRSAPQYANQISVVNGKKSGTDINLYKLFTEQCFNLLRDGGQCGIVIPSGIYTDLGTKQLRSMLFERTEITGLFCIENRRSIFEGVDSRFKFVVLTFEKGRNTVAFPAAFMRQDVLELERFPAEGALSVSVDLIKRLSPDSMSIMELKSDIGVRIAEKMLRFPPLGEPDSDSWRLSLSQEIHMTNDSHLFQLAPGSYLAPLVQGGMFNQFQYDFAPPKYWIDLKAGRAEILGRTEDVGQRLSYQGYRLVHRRIARNTDTRTLIATVLPPNTFCADTAQTVRNTLPGEVSLFIAALFNSFVVDYDIRQRVTAHCDMHFIYGLRIPRITSSDPAFRPIVERAARLICSTSQFDALAKEVKLRPLNVMLQNRVRETTVAALASVPQLFPPEQHALGDLIPEAPNEPIYGIIEPAGRARLRAEIDGLVAHLYGLSEPEFAYILASFPLVPDYIKVAAQNAYRDVERGLLP